MSNIANKVKKHIKTCFPNHRLFCEHYVSFQNNKLLFDFYLPEFKLLIEVQGQQHYSYNNFFHSNSNDFKSQKYRDLLKTQWADEEGYKLLKIKYDEIEDLTNESFRELVVNFI